MFSNKGDEMVDRTRLESCYLFLCSHAKTKKKKITLNLLYRSEKETGGLMIAWLKTNYNKVEYTHLNQFRIFIEKKTLIYKEN